MKKSSFIIPILVGLFIFGSATVKAVAVDEDTNIFKYQYDLAKTGNIVFGADENQKNMLTTYSEFQSTGLMVLAPQLGGYTGLVNSEVLKKIPVAQRTGMAQRAVVSMVTSFDTPTQNIPGVYASLFAPKSLVNSSVYAAGCSTSGSTGLGVFSTPPDCTDTWTYWTQNGVSRIWAGSFALAMIIVVLVLIISGFMIMFRSKAGGQTVVTVSMALQNVLFGAIMALASFALGAFFVNLSKYLTVLFANLLIQLLWTSLAGGFQGIVNALLSFLSSWGLSNGLESLFLTYPSAPTSVFGKFFIYMILGDAASFAHSATPLLQIFTMNLGGLATALSSLPSVLTSWFLTPITLISFIVVTGALLIVSIRIFWAVLQVYIKMMIDVVLAPLVFIIGALPGQQHAINDWLKRMLASSLKAPLMFAMINVTAYMTLLVVLQQFSTTLGHASILTTVTGGFIPNVGANNYLSADSLVAAVGPQNIIMIVLLNMVPSIPQLVDDMFAGKGTGAVGKSFETVKKSLSSIPLVGGMMQ